MQLINKLFLGFVVMSLVASAQALPVPKEQPVNYKVINVFAYSNFVGNWDDKAAPTLTAMITTPEQYNQIFHVAVVMRNTRPLYPSSNIYKNKQLLVLCNGLTVPDDVNFNKVYEVERLVQRGKELALYYKIADRRIKKSNGGYKIPLTLEIPKQTYTTVSFYESGKGVGRLNLAAGQWHRP